MADDDSTCCGSAREHSSADDHMNSVSNRGTAGSSTGTDPAQVDTSRMTKIPQGSFQMGTENEGFPADGEGPTRDVTLNTFYIDKYAVTNAKFIQFVKDTRYTTDAERFGWSFVFKDFLADDIDSHIIGRAEAAPWWVAVKGASWLHPEGPGSTVVGEDRLTHPVVHVSWRDAVAYAEWSDKRLPTEAEWECAARGGLEEKQFPWGDDLTPNGEHRCNIWQGKFPEENTGDDGYIGTAPVDAFEPNGFDCYNTSGNVWEWCSDWFSTEWHTEDRPETRQSPVGPNSGDSKVMRGGSYLCHDSWCNRYRVAARTENTPDSSTGNLGFRCVVDARK